MPQDFPIALLVSYRGSTAEAVVRSTLETGGALKKAGVYVNLVITSSSDVEAIRFATGVEGMKQGRKLKLDEYRIEVLDPRSGEFASEDAYGAAMLRLCQRWKIELLCLFGWLGPLPKNVREAYHARILRQFCGPMDPGPGRRDFFAPDLVGPGVHAAVLYYTRVLAGINGMALRPSTEVVSQLIFRHGDYDPVVGDQGIPILPGDNPTTLAERTIKLEHALQIETIMRAKAGTLVPRLRNAPLIPSRFHSALDEAMAVGRTLYPVERHLLPK